MTTLQKERNNVKINYIEIENHSGDRFDMTNLMREFQIYESMNHHFTKFMIKLHEQYDLKENIPLTGDEKFHVSFDCGDKKKEHTFVVTKIPSIMQIEENQMNAVMFEAVDEKFEPFMNKYGIMKGWKEATLNDVFTDVGSYYGVDIKHTVAFSEIFNYISYDSDVIRTIDDILTWTNEKPLFFQSGKSLYLSSYDFCFDSNEYYFFSNDSVQSGVYSGKRGTLKNIEKNDVIQRKEMQDKGINGHTFYDIDIFDEKYNLNGVNHSSEKFNFSSEKSNILVRPNYQHLEDEILMDYISADVTEPDGSYELGDKIVLKLKSTMPYNDDFSDYSGEYIIYEVFYSVNVNLEIVQTLSLVRK